MPGKQKLANIPTSSIWVTSECWRNGSDPINKKRQGKRKVSFSFSRKTIDEMSLLSTSIYKLFPFSSSCSEIITCVTSSASDVRNLQTRQQIKVKSSYEETDSTKDKYKQLYRKTFRPRALKRL